MKRNTLWVILAAEAILCVVLQFLRANVAGVFSAALAFPFEQIGIGLRALSLSGWAGNLAALVLYAAACLVPVAAMLVLFRRGFHREDWLLAVLSAALFGVLYLMVNPALIGSLFGGAAGLRVGKAILGGTVYSVLCGYLVLKVLRLFFAGSTGQLEKYMAVLLCLLNVLFVWLAFGACFGGMLDSMAALRAGNTGSGFLWGSFGDTLGGQLDASMVFLILQYAVNALPYVLDVFVVFAALRLLEELRAGRYSEESVAAARRLSKLCGGVLGATVLVSMAFNLLQLLFAKALLVIHSTVQIPVFSITFVLAVLLLARFVAENKQLKDDNDLFV